MGIQVIWATSFWRWPKPFPLLNKTHAGHQLLHLGFLTGEVSRKVVAAVVDVDPSVAVAYSGPSIGRCHFLEQVSISCALIFRQARRRKEATPVDELYIDTRPARHRHVPAR